MIVKVSTIELDTSIQCRATIDTAVVSDYSERMVAGDDFPPVELFGTKEKSWIGDGWHRTLAARSIERDSIEANLHPGGRAEALKHALGANVIHGHRRSNADKRRCVEIALREFPKMSDPAIAKLCGVDHKTVAAWRPATLGNSQPEHRTGQDGKQYPARRTAAEPDDVRLSISVNDAGIITAVRPYSNSTRPKPPNHYQEALEQAREWMVRWSHLDALAPVFDAITAALEQSRKGV